MSRGHGKLLELQEFTTTYSIQLCLETFDISIILQITFQPLFHVDLFVHEVTESRNGELPLTFLRHAGNVAFLVLPLHSVVFLLHSPKPPLFYRSLEFQDIEEFVI